VGHQQRGHALDPDRVAEALIAAERVHDDAVDVEMLRKVAHASIAALDAQHETFHAISGGGGGNEGGGASCEYWFTISCQVGGGRGAAGGGAHELQAAQGGDGPIAWGGGSCWQIGMCTYCVNYECHRDPA
jgi:hypothetical protein